MRRIRKLDEDPMSAGLLPDHDERLAVRVDEVPWQVVDRDVQMASLARRRGQPLQIPGRWECFPSGTG